MLEVKCSTKFKKDLKVCQKQHYDVSLLQQVINVLAIPAALQPQNKDHSLTGSYIPLLPLPGRDERRPDRPGVEYEREHFFVYCRAALAQLQLPENAM